MVEQHKTFMLQLIGSVFFQLQTMENVHEVVLVQFRALPVQQNDRAMVRSAPVFMNCSLMP